METALSLPFPFAVSAAFLLGLVIGSFSNACIYRLPKQESVVFPASRCTSCNTPIKAVDNIPVLSYLLLRGKCRACGQKISIAYPLIEIVTGLLFVAVVVKFGISWESLIYAIVCPALVIITVIDFQHQIIPDRITLPGIIFGLGAGSYLVGMINSGLGFLLGGGLFYLLAVLTQGRGMGGGDVKFIAGAGALLGWQQVLLVIFLAAVLGSVIGLALMAAQKKDRKSQIPFGPFLVLGTLAAIFFGEDLIRLYLTTVTSQF
ncbi:MAG: type 4 prepilin-like proteins leader peptide-processing enzyme [Nitrospinaceae bacterium]|nr:MAG: type 4 prepilin-like proteins leader peptide-processing enzyme [Nitrospinaceae bacterium]